MLPDNLLVKTLYEYQANDCKVLSCFSGERFIIIKQSKSDNDWLYVVNCRGKLGYIPANYTVQDYLDDISFLHLIDTIISVLDIHHNDCQIITTRQINHAHVKLTQLRCEVINNLYFNSTPSPDYALSKLTDLNTAHTLPNIIISSKSDYSSITNSKNKVKLYIQSKPNQNTSQFKENQKLVTKQIKSCHDASTQSDNDHNLINLTAKLSQDIFIQSDNDQNTMNSFNENKSSHHISTQSECQQNDKIFDSLNIKIEDNFISELIERIRVSTELSYEMCKFTIQIVINYLKEKIPNIKSSLELILYQLDHIDKNLSSLIIESSSDSIKLKQLFKQLWDCKNDQQQQNWPLHEDEAIINQCFTQLNKILINANPAISREAIAENSYDNVQMLINYFQMENRPSIKKNMYSTLIEIIKLNPNLIDDLLLPSVFPAALANEMINYQNDHDRWSNATLLFTLTFSSGQAPPVNIYEHVNKNFILKHFQMIEGEDKDSNKIDQNFPVEKIISPILAFNLHFHSPSNNLVLEALRSLSNFTKLMENLVSYLNWDEDPTLYKKFSKLKSFNSNRPNAVHKLLIEITGDKQLANHLYLNDVSLMIDIIITYLNNLLPGDINRINYLQITTNLVENTKYINELPKLSQLLKCLDDIRNHDLSNEQEKKIVNQIKSNLKN